MRPCAGGSNSCSCPCVRAERFPVQKLMSYFGRPSKTVSVKKLMSETFSTILSIAPTRLSGDMAFALPEIPKGKGGKVGRSLPQQSILRWRKTELRKRGSWVYRIIIGNLQKLNIKISTMKLSEIGNPLEKLDSVIDFEFLGLASGDKVSDANTIRNFFEGQIVDASFVLAPRQLGIREENKKIKECEDFWRSG